MTDRHTTDDRGEALDPEACVACGGDLEPETEICPDCGAWQRIEAAQ